MSCSRARCGSAESRAYAHPPWMAAERGRGMGHAMVTCDACHDQLRQATFYEPARDCGHDPLTGWVTVPPARP